MTRDLGAARPPPDGLPRRLRVLCPPARGARRAAAQGRRGARRGDRARAGAGPDATGASASTARCTSTRPARAASTGSSRRRPARRCACDRALGGGRRRARREVVVRAEDLRRRPPGRPARSRSCGARLEASRGERIGIVGPNGAGKTTLLRTIAGDLPLLDGSLAFGSQRAASATSPRSRDAPIPGETVLDALLAEIPMTAGRGPRVPRPVPVPRRRRLQGGPELSGGERSRLELALLGIMPANLLLLDEPTNHLDIPAREALEAFLRETTATLLLVSATTGGCSRRVCERLWVVDEAPRRPVRGGLPGLARRGRGRLARGRGVPARAGAVPRARQRRRDRRGGARSAGRAGAARDRDPGRATARARRSAPTQTAAARAPRQPKLSKDAYRRQKAVIEDDLARLGLRKSHLELALDEPDHGSELRRAAAGHARARRRGPGARGGRGGLAALEERAP